VSEKVHRDATRSRIAITDLESEENREISGGSGDAIAIADRFAVEYRSSAGKCIALVRSLIITRRLDRSSRSIATRETGEELMDMSDISPRLCARTIMAADCNVNARAAAPVARGPFPRTKA